MSPHTYTPMYGPVTKEQEESCRTLLSQTDPHVLNRLKHEPTQTSEQLLFLSFCMAYFWSGSTNKLRVVRQWSELEFNFPSQVVEQLAREKKYYVPGKSVPIDVDVHYRTGHSPRIFVTIPRFDEGRPVTLGTIDPQGRITGYPTYYWHDNQGSNCKGLTSVFRVAIDECNRLWVMDTGKVGESQMCPPQLLAFNLQNDELIYRHVVNSSSYVEASIFATPVVDVRSHGRGDCADTFVYVGDVAGFGVLVVDVAENRSWRLSHRYFYPYPSRGVFTIDGISFDLMDGIIGMALSPNHGPDYNRHLYFHALASTTESIVNTRVLRNVSHIDNPDVESGLIIEFPKERPTQSAAEAMDRDGILYFGLMEPPSIWCWNSATEFSQRNFHQISVEREALQFASGVKVVKDFTGEEELWIMTNSLQRVWTDSLESNKLNFRIHAEKISTLMKNSPCKKSPKGYLPI